MQQARCSIIVPAYNEATRIPQTLDNILSFIQRKSWKAEIIVVNDGSTDATADVVRAFRERFPSVVLVDNRTNQGKGRAIRAGVRLATAGIVLFTDADNSTPIEEAEKLFDTIQNGADIAIGSRWVDRELQVLPQPWYRRLNGRIYNRLLRAALGLEFQDTQNGFKAFTRDAANAIFSQQKIAGWGFDAEVLYLAQKLKLTVSEVPVEYVYCAEGSKIHPYRDGAKMLFELFRVKWNALTGAYSFSQAQIQSRNPYPGSPPIGIARRIKPYAQN